MNKQILAFAWILLVIGCSHQTTPSEPDTANGTAVTIKDQAINIRWLVREDEVPVVREMAEKFAEQVAEKSSNQLHVEIVSSQDLGIGDDPTGTRTLNILNKNKLFEITHVASTVISEFEPRYLVFDLPYLFKDEEHVNSVIESDISETLWSGLNKKNVVGLAFLYSGGFKSFITTDKKISRLEDFSGLKIWAANPSIVSDSIFDTLNIKVQPVRKMEWGIELTESHRTGGGEALFYHYWNEKNKGRAIKYVLETNINLFMNTLVINEKFFNGLSDKHKEIIRQAATTLARVERSKVIAANEAIKADLQKRNVQVNKFSQKEEARLRAKLKPIYAKYAEMIGRDLISRIETKASGSHKTAQAP